MAAEINQKNENITLLPQFFLTNLFLFPPPTPSHLHTNSERLYAQASQLREGYQRKVPQAKDVRKTQLRS